MQLSRRVVALTVLMGLLLTGGPTIPHQTPAPPAPAGAAPLARVPASLLPQMNADLAADDPVYAIAPLAEAPTMLRATDAARNTTATFTSTGVAIAGKGGVSWQLRLAAFDDGALNVPVVDTPPVADGARVEYQRGRLTEWYVNGPVGIEQGFTIAAPPAAGDTVTLTLDVTGAQPRLAGDGVLLALSSGETQRYAGLVASDARGETLPARLTVMDGTIRISVATAGAIWPVTVDPFVESHTFAANDAAPADALGVPVAVDTAGDVVVAAAKHKTISGKVVGEVYIWHVGAASTSFDLPSGFGASSGFGSGIAVSGDGTKVAVGIPTATTPKATGAGTVLVYGGPFYDLIASVYATHGATGDGYGSSIAMNQDGSIIAVGAPNSAVVIPPPSTITISAVGAVYLEYGANYNTEQTYVGELSTGDYHTDPGFELFGSSVALDSPGVTLAVGEPGFDPSGGSAGAIDVFNTSGRNGSLVAHLTASDAGTADTLGAVVAVSTDGKVVVGGAPDQTGSFANQGAAYVFSGANYGTQKKLRATSPAGSDYFGYSVAVNGTGSTVAVGTFNKNKVFVFSDTGYGLSQTITGNAPSTHFGAGLALSADGSTLVSGAPSEGGAGIVHIFTLQVPTPLPPVQPPGPTHPGPLPPIPSRQPAGPLNPNTPNPLPAHR